MSATKVDLWKFWTWLQLDQSYLLPATFWFLLYSGCFRRNNASHWSLAVT